MIIIIIVIVIIVIIIILLPLLLREGSPLLRRESRGTLRGSLRPISLLTLSIALLKLPGKSPMDMIITQTWFMSCDIHTHAHAQDSLSNKFMEQMGTAGPFFAELFLAELFLANCSIFLQNCFWNW